MDGSHEDVCDQGDHSKQLSQKEVLTWTNSLQSAVFAGAILRNATTMKMGIALIAFLAVSFVEIRWMIAVVPKAS